jgi:hypothetical protein
MALAAAVLVSCGVSEDEAVKLREGQTLNDLPFCGSFGCADPAAWCLELFFEFGTSPPLCARPSNICERLECFQQGQECRVFEGFPGQVRCVSP